MNQLFEILLGARPGNPQAVERTWAPAMDVSETLTELRVRVELPGIPRKDIEASIVKGALVIRGERRSAAASGQEQPLRLERSSGPFYRSLELPPSVDPDGARAVFRDGILEIRMPKRAGATSRAISMEES